MEADDLFGIVKRANGYEEDGDEDEHDGLIL